MGSAGYRVRVDVRTARLGRDEMRVLRPAQPLAALLLEADWWFDLLADRPAALRIGLLWLLAARSPRSLVHLPLRRNGPSPEPGDPAPRDLVLAHHSLRFPPSEWPDLRRRLGPAKPHTASLPEAERYAEVQAWPEFHDRENRDLFHERVYADTLFLTASAPAFRDSANIFFDIAEHDPALMSGSLGHYCAEYRFGPRSNARPLHVQYESAPLSR